MSLNMPTPAHTTTDTVQSLIGLPALMRMALSGGDLHSLGEKLLSHAQSHPADANALMDLSVVLQLRWKREIALAVQAQALQAQQLYRQPAASAQPAIRLLAMMGAGDLMANAPLEFLVEGSAVALDMLYVAPGQPLPSVIPEHDLLFIAVSECDQNHSLLQHIERLTKSWPHPVLNKPERIASLNRDSVCALLEGAPGLVMPLAARIDRQTLAQIGRAHLPLTRVLEEGGFPLIVRPVDSHAGRGLVKLDSAASIADYLQMMPESEFYISRFIDYRGADGLFRKYRIVLIDGQPFACHMGISQHWMIHYLNAGMAESAEKRAEEARFIATFDTGFAPRHQAALDAIYTRMGLDYLVLDCAETRAGALLIFEADTSAVVHAMDPIDIFPYKQSQMHKVFDAFQALLSNTMQRSQPFAAE